MFQTWRLKVREAEEALKAGRLEEAQQQIAEGGLIEYLPGKKLAARVAACLVNRVREQLRGTDLSAGWRDLAAAAGLGLVRPWPTMWRS